LTQSTERLGNGELDAVTELHRVNLSPENRFEASPLRGNSTATGTFRRHLGVLVRNGRDHSMGIVGVVLVGIVRVANRLRILSAQARTTCAWMAELARIAPVYRDAEAGAAINGHGADTPMEVSSAGTTDLDQLVMFVVDASRPFSSPAKFD